MSKNTELAAAILEQVGGRENIADLYHCMTRLRFSLKDQGIVDQEKIKSIKGVMGVQAAENELQVIIGPAVAVVCAELGQMAGIAESRPSEENPDEGTKEKEKLSPKLIGNKIMGAISGCMSPLVPLFIVVGMANVVAAVIGPSMLGLVGEEAPIYTNFYWMGQAIIYFLPTLTAITAAKYFKAEPMIALALAGIMLYPDLLAALSAEGGYTVYGIGAPNVAYSGQIIPIILVVWVQSYVEKGLKKIVPDIVKVLLVPFGTVVVMLPLMLCVLGPIGDRVGALITGAVMALYHVAGPLEAALVCATLPFLTAFGIGRPLFFACMTVLMSEGVEFSYMPYALCLSNFTIMGCCAGYILKTKSVADKQAGITGFVANFLGGVSEPTLFGIILPHPKTFVPLLIGGAVSGLYAGIMKVGAYQMGTSNFLSVLTFVNPQGGSNFLYGCIGAVLSFIITFAMMLLLYRENEKKKAS